MATLSAPLSFGLAKAYTAGQDIAVLRIMTTEFKQATILDKGKISSVSSMHINFFVIQVFCCCNATMVTSAVYLCYHGYINCLPLSYHGYINCLPLCYGGFHKGCQWKEMVVRPSQVRGKDQGQTWRGQKHNPSGVKVYVNLGQGPSDQTPNTNNLHLTIHVNIQGVYGFYIQMLPFMTRPEARVEHRCLASGI